MSAPFSFIVILIVGMLLSGNIFTIVPCLFVAVYFATCACNAGSIDTLASLIAMATLWCSVCADGKLIVSLIPIILWVCVNRCFEVPIRSDETLVQIFHKLYVFATETMHKIQTHRFHKLFAQDSRNPSSVKLSMVINTADLDTEAEAKTTSKGVNRETIISKCATIHHDNDDDNTGVDDRDKSPTPKLHTPSDTDSVDADADACTSASACASTCADHHATECCSSSTASIIASASKLLEDLQQQYCEQSKSNDVCNDKRRSSRDSSSSNNLIDFVVFSDGYTIG